MTDLSLPTYDLLEPAVLQVLVNAGGSLTRREIKEQAPVQAKLTDEQLAATYTSGKNVGRSIVIGRVGWAISHLKMMEAVDSSLRGVWSITSHGRELLAAGPEAITEANKATRLKTRKARGIKSKASIEETEVEAQQDLDSADDESWKAELLTILTSMQPDAFERLCGRLLREIGFRDVEVTSYSDDEGLDGIGVLEVSLLSFPVFFQAKRYQVGNAIQPNKIREFRGAMAQRGDKGFFITTSVFTSRARDEAKRGGAPIDLIDGDRLCDLLRENNIGVEMRPAVNKDFFDGI